MFEVIIHAESIYIQNKVDWMRFLHSDGSIYRTVEYFESKEVAQKVLHKYYPRPKHEWKHGDVFFTGAGRRNSNNVMIYLNTHRGIELFCVGVRSECCSVSHRLSVDCWLVGATFLFNIKDVIKEKI